MTANTDRAKGLTHEIATVLCNGPGLKLPGDPKVTEWRNQENRITPCNAYQSLLAHSAADVLVYVHDDVTVHDPEWLFRILSLFEAHPECVAVGVGGADGLGSPDLYRKPWNIWNLARSGYCSNQTDWKTHGSQETGVKRVAVLDAFCMAVRTEWLRRRGGWPVSHLTFHCLDLWLACEAARDGKETWMVGASCTHHGGGSSTKAEYAKAGWLQGGSLESDHQEPHFFLYNEYRDVFPIRGGI